MSNFLKLALCLLAFITSAGLADDSADRLPIVEYKVPLETVGFLMSHGSNGITLPQLQVYDGNRIRLANIVGVPTNRFIALADEALQRKQGDMEMRLAAGGWKTMEGGPVDIAALPPADAYFVEYWADWCKPCHQLQEDLFEYLHEHDINAVVIKVELDPMPLYAE